jgi:hypothetical protein
MCGADGPQHDLSHEETTLNKNGNNRAVWNLCITENTDNCTNIVISSLVSAFIYGKDNYLKI